MDLHAELERLLEKEFQMHPPPNESCTCDWVILPLLHAIGYQYRDIYSRIVDGGGAFPDYTILKNEPQEFYLEAKSWQDKLRDEHANQSLNYANQNGKRWVVLTNGKNWRLYDNRVEGKAAEKLIAEINIDDQPDANHFFDAIGKDSLLSGGIATFAASQNESRKIAAEERRQKLLLDQVNNIQAKVSDEPRQFVSTSGSSKQKREQTGYAVFIKLLDKPIKREDLIAGMVNAGFTSSTAASYIAWSRRVVDESEMNPFGFQTEDFKDQQGVKFLRRRNALEDENKNGSGIRDQ